MAGKFLEIIKKTSDFDNNEMSLLCRDTSFGGVGKKVSSELGQTLENVAPSQKVGYQLFEDIRTKQDVMYQRFSSLINSYNSWLENVVWNRYGRGGASEYPQYIIPSPPNHIVNEGDNADFNLLTEIINLDQASLYGSYHDLTLERFPSNIQKLKEWSKNRIYGSCVGLITSRYVEMNREYSWRSIGISSSVAGVSANWEFNYPRRGNRMLITGLTNIPVGGNVVLTATWDGLIFRCRINRNSLGSVSLNDGKIVHHSTTISGSGEVQGSSEIRSYTGNHSPHFNIPVGVAPYNFLKTRNINI